MPPVDGKLVIVRHGETPWNVAGRFNSRTDIGLSERGRDDVARLAKELASWTFDSVLVSPAARARATAAALCAGRPVAPRVVDAAGEVDFGRFEGWTRAGLMGDELGAEFTAWERGGEGGGAEPLQAAAVRARGVVRSLSSGGVTALVTHGVFARVLILATALGGDASGYRRLRVDTASWSCVDWADGFPRLTHLNVCPSSLR